MILSTEERSNKLKIVYNLLRYFRLLQVCAHNEHKLFKNCFKKSERLYGKGLHSREFYDKIRNDYFLVSSINLFSLIKDEFLSMINNDELNKLKFDFTSIFVNPEEANKFSRKQTVNYMRNALNHSNENDLYKIIDNNKIEIKLEKTNPEFHVIISSEDLYNLSMEIINYTNYFYKFTILGLDKIDINSISLYSDLQNLKIERICTNGKKIDGFDFEVYNKVLRELTPSEFELLKEGKLKLDFNEHKNINEIEYNYKRYDLNLFQIDTIYYLIQRIKASNLFDLSNKNEVKGLLEYCVRQILPFGMANAESINGSIHFCNSIMDNWNNSLNKAFRMYENKNFLNDDIKWTILNRDENLVNSIMIYCFYIFSNYGKDNYVTIGNKVYNISKMRNSFVHGRWMVYFERDKKEIMLYDSYNGINNEVKYNWLQKVSTDELILISRYLIMEEELKYQMNDNFNLSKSFK